MNVTLDKIVRHFSVWLSFVAFLISLSMLLAYDRFPATSIWHHMIRDLGIGFFVAALVGAMFELHMRVRFSSQTMGEVLDIALGDVIDPEVWREAKSQVLSREIIRKNNHVHLGIEPIADCPGRAVLRLKFEYDLCGLHPQTRRAELVHELDDFLKYGDYPRFQFIQVGRERYEGENLQRKLEHGRFCTSVELPGKDGKSITVISLREEIVYLPGSYTLTMTELTNGTTLHLEELPAEIEAEVTLRPHTPTPVALRKDVPLDSEFKTTLLLPGQGIEFRFQVKAEPLQAVRPAGPVAVAAA